MEKKYYKVNVEHINFDNDTSNMRKDYSFAENSYVTGDKTFGTLIVYEEDGIFKELVSGIQITSIAESVVYGGPNPVRGFPNAERYDYKHEINGKYPVYFIYNITPETRTTFSAPLLKDLEASKEYIDYYVNFIKDNYTDEKTNDYSKNWKDMLLDSFELVLYNYNKIVEENGYSNEYLEEHEKQKIK